MDLVLRTYRGRAPEIAARLLPNLRMFVEPDVRVQFILDAESGADREYAKCLVASSRSIGHSVHVSYAILTPRLNETIQHGYGRGHGPIPGYDRQNYDTFFIDRHADREVVGVLDSDACLTSFLTRRDVFSADGRIHLHAVRDTDHWEGAWRKVLGLGDAPRVDVMWADLFPIFFWRSTFAAFRNATERRLGMPFLEAFAQFSSTRRSQARDLRPIYSPVNIVASWALANEPHRYLLVPEPSEAHAANLASQASVFGSHKTCGYCEDRAFVALGCCDAFNVSCDRGASRRRDEMRGRMLRLATTAAATAGNDGLASPHEALHRHLKHVRKAVARLKPRQRAAMAAECSRYVSTWKPRREANQRGGICAPPSEATGSTGHSMAACGNGLFLDRARGLIPGDRTSRGPLLACLDSVPFLMGLMALVLAALVMAARLCAYPPPRQWVLRLERLSGQHLGITVSDIEGGGGVRIDHLHEGDCAWRAGLREGDVIVQLDGDSVKGCQDVIERVEAARGLILVTVVRYHRPCGDWFCADAIPGI